MKGSGKEKLVSTLQEGTKSAVKKGFRAMARFFDYRKKGGEERSFERKSSNSPQKFLTRIFTGGGMGGVMTEG